MKIALLGSAPSSRFLAPFNDPSWEIWACSASNTDLPRSDFWFEMHATDRRTTVPKLVKYYEWLKGHPAIYMQYVDPDFPGSIEFPKDEIVKEFGNMFFTSSVAWMLALAISKISKNTGDPEKVIGLWGIDMAASDEYDYQRMGCHHFIYEAQRRGIEIIAPGESDILQPYPLYGYKEQSPMWRKLDARGNELDQRIEALNKNIQKAQNEVLVLRGAREGVDYAMTWVKAP